MARIHVCPIPRRVLTVLLCLMLFGQMVLIGPAAALSVCQPEDTEESLPFKDVSPSSWFYRDVKFVYDNHLMNGIAPDRFGPDLPVTRAMFVTILYRREGSPIPGNCPFDDVSPGLYYADAAAWAASQNIVTGTAPGLFSPDLPLSRQQMAVILYRFAAYRGLDTTADPAVLALFSDADEVSGYAVQAMAWAVENSLLRGSNAQTLDPDDPATRAQAAVILRRFLI